MIVLVDTSVWIRFLSNRTPYAAELDRLLSRDEVSGHAFVYGELLIGDADGRNQLLNDYEQMHQAPVVAHDEVVAFMREQTPVRARGWLDRCPSAGVGARWTTEIVDDGRAVGSSRGGAGNRLQVKAQGFGGGVLTQFSFPPQTTRTYAHQVTPNQRADRS